jgi:hypothetical protein
MKLVYKVGTRWQLCDISRARFAPAHTYQHQTFDPATCKIGKLRTSKRGDSVIVAERQEEFKRGIVNQIRVLRSDIENDVAEVDAEIQALENKIAAARSKRSKLLEHGFYSGKPLKRDDIQTPAA